MKEGERDRKIEQWKKKRQMKRPKEKEAERKNEGEIESRKLERKTSRRILVMSPIFKFGFDS